MPTLELIALVVEVVHLRQAGVSRSDIEQHLTRERRLPRHAARRLLTQVDHELQIVTRRGALRLALSAEALQAECVEVLARQPARN